MKDYKIYNIFFPIWMIIFFPPILFASLFVNFIVDTVVLVICLYIYSNYLSEHVSLGYGYRMMIVKVWIWGFVSDFIGALYLLLLMFVSGKMDMDGPAINAIMRNPFENIFGVLIVLSAIFISAVLIYYFNNSKVLVKHIEDKIVRAKIAMIIAIVTAPWSFLLPTEWIYRWQ